MLKNNIKSLISQTGPISMAQFMHLALSHPTYGYYKTREPFGTEGDFITSPEISQIFGELIGIWCVDVWLKMGAPEDVVIAEIGPGRGTLMQDFLRATRNIKGFHNNISIAMVETSERLCAMQAEKINHLHPRINWFENIGQLPQKPLIVIANELFDALPVHQYVRQRDNWHEKMLGLNMAGELEFKLAFEPSGINRHETGEIHEGSVLEVCNDAALMISELAKRIKQHGGAALIIDYGYIETPYKDTVSAIGKHQHHKLLDDIGNVDISAHVDFNFLKKQAESEGMAVSGPTLQGDFLRRIGIDLRMESLAKNATAKQREDMESAVKRLIGPGKDEMGELFKVLAITGGILCLKGFKLKVILSIFAKDLYLSAVYEILRKDTQDDKY